MKINILTFFLFIICIGTISAITIYPGQTEIYPNEMGIENLDYTIIGNSTNLSELDIKVNSTNISVTFPQDMIPGNYKIVFFEHQTETIIQEVHVGGGGGGTRTIFKDRNITTYVDKEVEVLGETIEIEKEVEVEKEVIKIPWIIIIIIIFILLILVYLLKKVMIDTNTQIDERGLENQNE